MAQRRRHRMPFGAETDGLGETRYRLRAPATGGVGPIIESQPAMPPMFATEPSMLEEGVRRDWPGWSVARFIRPNAGGKAA
jgi:hypothetical protein